MPVVAGRMASGAIGVWSDSAGDRDVAGVNPEAENPAREAVDYLSMILRHSAVPIRCNG